MKRQEFRSRRRSSSPILQKSSKKRRRSKSSKSSLSPYSNMRDNEASLNLRKKIENVKNRLNQRINGPRPSVNIAAIPPRRPGSSALGQRKSSLSALQTRKETSLAGVSSASALKKVPSIYLHKKVTPLRATTPTKPFYSRACNPGFATLSVKKERSASKHSVKVYRNKDYEHRIKTLVKERKQNKG